MTVFISPAILLSGKGAGYETTTWPERRRAALVGVTPPWKIASVGSLISGGNPTSEPKCKSFEKERVDS